MHLLLSLAVSSNWPLHQLDVQNTFLHGDLEEAVFIKQPPGFINPDHLIHVCKLRKSIYGLKQAPQAWFAKLTDKLLELGFHGSRSDSSLFILHTKSDCLYILIYVDDIIVTGSSSILISDFIASLSLYFPVKDLGQLHYFLGVEVHYLSSGLFLSWSKYIADLLFCTNMHKSKSVSTPMTTSVRLTAFDGPTFEDPQLYQSIVGSRQYLSFTRLDISFAMNKVCHYALPSPVSLASCKMISQIPSKYPAFGPAFL